MNMTKLISLITICYIVTTYSQNTNSKGITLNTSTDIVNNKVPSTIDTVVIDVVKVLSENYKILLENVHVEY
jgi:hypothetical protein